MYTADQRDEVALAHAPASTKPSGGAGPLRDPATDMRPGRRPPRATTGVRRRRSQVCPRDGRRVNPASTSKQMWPPQVARHF